MTRLIAALAILLVAIVCVYAIERIGFRQPTRRAATIALSLLFGSSEIGLAVGLLILFVSGLLLSIVAIPLGYLYFLQVIQFGQHRAKTMQPAVWVKRMFSWPAGPRGRVESAT